MMIDANSTYGAGSTGGSATHNHGGATGSHTLTIDQIPGHTHGMQNHTHTTYIGSHEHDVGMRGSNRGLCDTRWEAEDYGLTQTDGFKNRVIIWRDGVYDKDYWVAYSAATDLGSKTSGGPSNNTTTSTGGGKGHTHGIDSADNMPPWIGVYMWQRTA
jgi:hypothetical protein